MYFILLTTSSLYFYPPSNRSEGITSVILTGTGLYLTQLYNGVQRSSGDRTIGGFRYAEKGYFEVRSKNTHIKNVP